MRKEIIGNPITTPMKVSDLNQNDPKKSDYVKNRTHYTEKVDGKEIVHPLDKKYLPEDIVDKVDGLQGGYVVTKPVSINETFTFDEANTITTDIAKYFRNNPLTTITISVYNEDGEPIYERQESGIVGGAGASIPSKHIRIDDDYFQTLFIWSIDQIWLDFDLLYLDMKYDGIDPTLAHKTEVSIIAEGAEIYTKNLSGAYIATNSISYDHLEKTVPTKIYNELVEKLPFATYKGTAKVDYANTKLHVTFRNADIVEGTQIYYDLVINGENVRGVSKPATIEANNEDYVEIIIGNKYLTDYALKGTVRKGLSTVVFDFLNPEANYSLEVKAIEIVVPMPAKLLGLSEGIRAGYDTTITDESKNTHNFGTNNYIDGNYNAVFGTGHSVEGDNCTVYGQGGKIKGNLVFFGGDRCDIPGRCEFGWGTDIYMSGGNSGAIGYGLRSTGQNQFVIGQFNEENAEAYLIVGSGTENEKRKNAFMVTKDGKVFIDGVQLVKLTQTDKDKLNSFNSSGIDNVDSGKSSTQFGVRNHNTQENVMQIGRQNSTEGSQGGYIYQFGYNNLSQAGQNYLIGRNLKSAVYEQFVLGKYNEADKDALFILGSGTSDTARKNAIAVKKSGDVYFEGSVYSKGNKVLTGSDLNTFNGTIESLTARIQALEDERVALYDSINFLQSDINALGARIEALENK